MTPQTNDNSELVVRKEVFDLDSKKDQIVVKRGKFTPVSDMQDFLNRLNNDSAAVLAVVNDGLRNHEEKKLESDKSVAWEIVSEDENGDEIYSPVPESFAPISEARKKDLKASIISFAKLLFGYERTMVKGDDAANAAAKKKAKDDALAMIMSNPAAVEKLKGE